MLLDNMYIEIFLFEDQFHDLTYDVEDDMYLQKLFDIYDMQLDLHDDLIHVHVNHSIKQKVSFLFLYFKINQHTLSENCALQ